MLNLQNARRTVLVTGSALMLAVSALTGFNVPRAFAHCDCSEITTTVDAGDLSIDLNDGNTIALSSVDASFEDQDSSATVTLVVSDTTGSGKGWTVTVQADNLTYQGTNPGGSAIAASRFQVYDDTSISDTEGQSVDATHGPKFSDTADLSSQKTIVTADQGYGMGVYSVDIVIELSIPAYSRAGSYSGTFYFTAIENIPPV